MTFIFHTLNSKELPCCYPHSAKAILLNSIVQGKKRTSRAARRHDGMPQEKKALLGGSSGRQGLGDMLPKGVGRTRQLYHHVKVRYMNMELRNVV